MQSLLQHWTGLSPNVMLTTLMLTIAWDWTPYLAAYSAMSLTRCRWIRRSSPVQTVRPSGLAADGGKGRRRALEHFHADLQEVPNGLPGRAHDWRPARPPVLPRLAVGPHLSASPATTLACARRWV